MVRLSRIYTISLSDSLFIPRQWLLVSTIHLCVVIRRPTSQASKDLSRSQTVITHAHIRAKELPVSCQTEEHATRLRNVAVIEGGWYNGLGLNAPSFATAGTSTSTAGHIGGAQGQTFRLPVRELCANVS